MYDCLTLANLSDLKMDLVHSSREMEQKEITIASNTTKATDMMCVPTKNWKKKINLHFSDNVVFIQNLELR